MGWKVGGGGLCEGPETLGGEGEVQALEVDWKVGKGKHWKWTGVWENIRRGHGSEGASIQNCQAKKSFCFKTQPFTS